MRGAGERRKPDDGAPRLDGRAQRPTAQRVLNDEEPLDGERDDVPDSEEAADVGDRLTRSLSYGQFTPPDTTQLDGRAASRRAVRIVSYDITSRSRHKTGRFSDARSSRCRPDADAGVGDVGKRAAGAVQSVDVDGRAGGPRQHHARQKRDADDADGRQVDARRPALHRALAEDEQRDEVAEQTGDDDDRCDIAVKQAGDHQHRAAGAGESISETGGRQ